MQKVQFDDNIAENQKVDGDDYDYSDFADLVHLSAFFFF